MTVLVTNIQGYSIHDGPGIRTVVFLKGCGLECRWCSNPECISARPEVGFYQTLCTKCGKCAEVCPSRALHLDTDQYPRIERELCVGCGECSRACSYGALVLFGKPMTVEAVFEAVSRDKLFYKASGGGITLSGGECLLYPDFVSILLNRCRGTGIHTCIETSGQAPTSALRQVMQYTDYILFDLKLQDSARHRQYTGQVNKLILSNARLAARSGIELLFRMPLIPGINDAAPDITATAAFLKDSGLKQARIELMPYHRLGKGKYTSLDRPFNLPDLQAPEPDNLERVKNHFEELGVQCTISQ